MSTETTERSSDAKWQATGWSWPRSTRAGSSTAQISCAFQQRVLKRQPLGGLTGLGTSPSRTIRLPRPLGTWVGERDRRQERLRIRMGRPLVDIVLGADLDDLPEVHDRHSIRDVPDDGQVVRDEEEGNAETVLKLF